MSAAFVCDIDDLRCISCSKRLVPKVYHCTDNHTSCGNCFEKHYGLCSQVDCLGELYPCEPASSLLENMQVNCRGCTDLLTVKDFEQHSEVCLRSQCVCPCCGVDCVQQNVLTDHFANVHGTKKVLLESTVKLEITDGQTYILEGESTNEFFLLKFEGAALSLHHMWWAVPQRCCLSVGDGEETWHLLGDTTKLSSIPEQVVGGCLLIPTCIIPENHRIKCQVVLILDSTRTPCPEQAMVGVISKVKGGKCGICYNLAPQLRHCKFGHQICDECRTRRHGESTDVNCFFCFQTLIKCEIGNCILSKIRRFCPNKDTGCPLGPVLLPIEDFRHHVQQCGKTLFSCPVCVQGFEDFDVLNRHLVSTHPVAKVRYGKTSLVMIDPGRHLVQEETSTACYLLIYEDHSLCLQHIWTKPKTYTISFEHGPQEWFMMGRTTKVEEPPRLSARSLELPPPRPPIPIKIAVHVRIAG